MERNNSVKSSVVCVVRNEHDIISYVCRQFEMLFDMIVIIDHLSDDGTREYLAALCNTNRKFQVYDFVDRARNQSRLMNLAVKRLLYLEDMDWVFLLDADEFLPFEDKASFLEAMSALSDSPIISMPWKNLIPTSYDNRGHYFEDRIWVPKYVSSYRKIAFQPRKIGSTDFWITPGNHSINEQQHGKAHKSTTAFPIYHLPVRSVDQFTLKLLQGLTLNRLDPMRRTSEGFHYQEMYELSRKSGFTRDVLNWIAANYGAHGDGKIGRLYDMDLESSGYELKKIEIAQCYVPALDGRVPVSEVLFRVATTLLDSGRVLHEMDSSLLRLEVDDEKKIDWRISTFSSLREPCECNSKLKDLSGGAFLLEWLRPSMYPIKVVPASAWSGHIPFLFCLIAALRPRRHVELGVHNGGSFFAACQAYQDHEVKGRCIAVDSWEGDKHAGFHDDTVFTDFASRLSRHFSDVGSYIKGNFNEVAHYFSNESIDILHIDGLHTYEAVSNDYFTWKDKLTKEGVILFHDICEYRDDFGVWSFWADLKTQYPHLEFTHSHGLGLLYLGDDGENPIYKLIELCNSNRSAYDYLQWFFKSIGEVSVN
ncbi:MAG: class I SAM-dependent methyltransferase, partial [Pseudomonadota bacterium]